MAMSDVNLSSGVVAEAKKKLTVDASIGDRAVLRVCRRQLHRDHEAHAFARTRGQPQLQLLPAGRGDLTMSGRSAEVGHDVGAGFENYRKFHDTMFSFQREDPSPSTELSRNESGQGRNGCESLLATSMEHPYAVARCRKHQ